MAMREPTYYVYKLDVVYPEGSDAPGWQPAENYEERWGTDPETGGAEVFPFEWPRPRRCLSYSTAKRWATQLTKWGCKVEIVRSQPVAWDETTSDTEGR